MDIADQAEQQEAMQREVAIQAARANSGPKLQHTGECHYCTEEIEPPKLFCNSHCAKRYEHSKGH
nr:hypothetical protein 8 [Piscirickettsiaceae bacterium]